MLNDDLSKQFIISTGMEASSLTVLYQMIDPLLRFYNIEATLPKILKMAIFEVNSIFY
jgi:hypothetical protein